MNKGSQFSYKKFIFSVLLNAAVLFVALYFFVPFFEENDDAQICMIAEGLFGKREWHLIYANAVLGKIYLGLEAIMPYIRWHVILQYVFIFIAYVFSVYVISKHKRGLFISIVAVLASFYEMYVSIQYTKTAAFVCAAGFILIFEYVRNKTSLINANDTMISEYKGYSRFENILFLAVAAVLILYGALLRPEGFFLAAVPAAAAGIVELLRTKNIVKYLLTFGPVFAAVILLSFVNNAIYKNDSDWSRFMEYNKARMQVNDYRYDILDFTRYADKLNELKVSENDALAILTYQFGDDSEFSCERFTEIRNAFPAKEFGYMTFANLFENLVNELPRSYTMIAGVGGIILILIATIVTDRSKSSPGFIKDSRRKFYLVVMMALFCGSAIIYFQYSGRYSHRLLSSIVIPTAFLICYIIDSIYIRENDSKIIFGGNKNDVSMPASLVLIIILIGLNGLLYMNNIKDYNDKRAENDAILRELTEMGRDSQSLYVADTFTFNDVYKYEVFTPFEEGSLSNFVNCGSWYINSPVTKAVTRKFGYENPFDALRDSSDNVYLLDNGNTECKLLFLTEHYDKVYEAQMLEKRGGIDVYRVVETDR